MPEAESLLRRLRRENALGGAITLLPGPRGPAEWQRHVQRRLAWGVRYLELRDDLFDDAALAGLAALIPAEHLLLSARRPRSAGERPALFRLAEVAARLDWPLELGPCPAPARHVASLHTRGPDEPLAAAIARLEAAGAAAPLLKLAVPIRGLAELFAGHAWAAAEPRRRVFLPSGSGPDAGRWAFYRLWRGDGLPLNFVRERPGRGTAPSPDQPALTEWLERRGLPTDPAGGPPFAAILGDPVAHSLTPAEQGPFFRARGWPVLRIRITEADLREGDPLDGLVRLGLRAAAVTAPLKQEARRWLARRGGDWIAPAAAAIAAVPEVGDACNTLARTAGGRLAGTSTDGDGLLAAWAEARGAAGLTADAAVALWGGGGTLSLLRAAFPGARAYSARSGGPRDGAPDPGFRPAVVVWAAGRRHTPAEPPAGWRPALVLDLDYTDDSAGRRYAAAVGARYASGLAFFRAQAAAQRRFWSALGI